MLLAQGFPPVARADARLLILGSMPGQASLRSQAYYAHPRNAFWPILADTLNFVPDLPYTERLEILQANGIALWDVLAACHRPGSLDADIEDSSIVVNDFVHFFKQHPQIQTICINGGKADVYWRRYVIRSLSQAQQQKMRVKRLPSTSPANAAIPYKTKLIDWKSYIKQNLEYD